MAFSKIAQFERKKKKKRKLCTDEVGRVKMKKNEKKKPYFVIKKMYFLYCSFGFAFQRG